MSPNGSNEQTRPLPHLEEWNRPFFAGGAEHTLRLQQCDQCAAHIYYPRLFCNHCGSRDLTWTSHTGTGTVYSFTTVWKPEHPYFLDQIPITMAAIKLDGGPTIFARVEDAPDTLAIDDRVEVNFEQIAPEIYLPVFRVPS